MIQDIAPHRFHNEFRRDAAPSPEDCAVFYRDGAFLLISDGDLAQLRFPRFSELLAPERVKEPFYLFSIDDRAFFAFWEDVDPSQLPAGAGWHSMRELRGRDCGPRDCIYAVFTAYHLLEWYLANRFCGRCGAAVQRDASERALVCPSCGQKVYPRINPAVIIGVINGDSLLLTRYRGRHTNFNALVAGFTEIGETLEETVAREVMEEVGLRVKNIRYYRSQPWGVAQDLLAGFFCEVDGSDQIRMDETELKYAEWVPRAGIELQPTDYSLTNEMMRMFRDGKIGGQNG